MNPQIKDEDINSEGDPEGTDDSQPTGWGSDYPLDSVFVRSEQRTVAEVVKRINAGRYQLDPDFQRDFVWPITSQSRLIESCIMRIPLPVFYVAEALDGRIAVVDGLQRLTSFHRYLRGDFALILHTGEDQPAHPLDGKKFQDLPIQLQERIEDTQLTLYILDAKAPERAKLDIFERVNSGAPLTRQQMRNCLFNGEATQWLKQAATTPAFLAASGRSLKQKSMRDREAINRFCAFHILGEGSYKSGDMDDFLARALKIMNENPKILDGLTEQFIHSMNANRYLFGDHAFRKSLAKREEFAPRSVLNIALFDAFSVLLVNYSEESIKDNAELIKEKTKELIENPTFIHSITYSTNSTKQVHNRFKLAREMLSECFQ